MVVSCLNFRSPMPNAGPDGITLGPDGNLWFTDALPTRSLALTRTTSAFGNSKSPQQTVLPCRLQPARTVISGSRNPVATRLGKSLRMVMSRNSRFQPAAAGRFQSRLARMATSGLPRMLPIRLASGFSHSQRPNSPLALPAAAQPAAPFSVTVTALDNLKIIVPGYTAAVHFTSSDPWRPPCQVTTPSPLPTMAFIPSRVE